MGFDNKNGMGPGAALMTWGMGGGHSSHCVSFFFFYPTLFSLFFPRRRRQRLRWWATRICLEQNRRHPPFLYSLLSTKRAGGEWLVRFGSTLSLFSVYPYLSAMGCVSCHFLFGSEYHGFFMASPFLFLSFRKGGWSWSGVHGGADGRSGASGEEGRKNGMVIATTTQEKKPLACGLYKGESPSRGGIDRSDCTGALGSALLCFAGLGLGVW